ncbi:MAG: hypothetical protein H3C35_02450 [Bacteroidetes bacterium]|nr:hypothetical protein [Bacteroidota bacterium]
MTFSCETLKRSKRIRVYAASAFKQCLLRSVCTRSRTNGRCIYRRVGESVIEIIQARMKDYTQKARQKKQLVEHPVGTMKRRMNCSA